jgi:hypothetical protein
VHCILIPEQGNNNNMSNTDTVAYVMHSKYLTTLPEITVKKLQNVLHMYTIYKYLFSTKYVYGMTHIINTLSHDASV